MTGGTASEPIPTSASTAELRSPMAPASASAPTSSSTTGPRGTSCAAACEASLRTRQSSSASARTSSGGAAWPESSRSFWTASRRTSGSGEPSADSISPKRFVELPSVIAAPSSAATARAGWA